MGCIALILAAVPFVAFWKGPEIRRRSKYSRMLMEEERLRVEEAAQESMDTEAEMELHSRIPAPVP